MGHDYHSFEQIRIEGVIFSLSEEYGAIVVYSDSSRRGYVVHADLDGNSSQRFSANVVERVVNGKPTFIAVFPRLKEGRYEVKGVSYGSKWTSVFPGHVAEVDCR